MKIMAGKHVPGKAVSLECDVVYISVREAARILGLSARSVYGYAARGKLTKKWIDERIMLIESEVLAFDRTAPGRPRALPPFWHLPPEKNPLSVTTIVVRTLPGCDELLEDNLTEFRTQGKHHLAGTSARLIGLNRCDPHEVHIILLWRGAALPADEQRETELAALAADLSRACDWTTAVMTEVQMLLHAR
jgi:hypothetical protein